MNSLQFKTTLIEKTERTRLKYRFSMKSKRLLKQA